MAAKGLSKGTEQWHSSSVSQFRAAHRPEKGFPNLSFPHGAVTALKQLHRLPSIHKLFLQLIYFLLRTPPQIIFEYSFLLLVSGTFLPL